ncbi:hypothetical protein [Arcobacter venerupis]|jgi:hypothetical protein|nr:hypothetical protein [Arcobacter venerupis]
MFTSSTVFVISSLFAIVISFQITSIGIYKTIDLIKKMKDL